MAGKLIPFPHTSQSTTEAVALIPSASPIPVPALAQNVRTAIATADTHGIHLVASPAWSPGVALTSQQRARKIVEEVRQRGVLPVQAALTERSPQFWAALPLPETRMETPLTVARRLVHLLLANPA